MSIVSVDRIRSVLGRSFTSWVLCALTALALAGCGSGSSNAPSSSVSTSPQSPLSSGVSLVPDTAGTEQSFAIVHLMSNSVDSFSTFSDLATALMTDLNSTTGVLQVMAEGSYANGALTADHIIVALDD